MKNRTNTGLVGRVRAAIDGWVRSFSLRDKDLYTDRVMDSEAGWMSLPRR